MTYDWEREMRLRQERERKYRDERRVEFFVVNERTDIPSLEFETPECSVCGLNTVCDGDSFSCEECGITWPRSGYGHQAEVDREVNPYLFKASDTGGSGA